MKKRAYIPKAEREKITEFQAGRLDTLYWLQNQFEKELCELETMHNNEVLNMDLYEFLLAKAKKEMFFHYLEQIKRVKGKIKNG